MKLAMLTLLVAVSCGRKGNNECRNRESMKYECQVVNTPAYGTAYARELCNRTYSVDKCY